MMVELVKHLIEYDDKDSVNHDAEYDDKDNNDDSTKIKNQHKI